MQALGIPVERASDLRKSVSSMTGSDEPKPKASGRPDEAEGQGGPGGLRSALWMAGLPEL